MVLVEISGIVYVMGSRCGCFQGLLVLSFVCLGCDARAGQSLLLHSPPVLSPVILPSQSGVDGSSAGHHVVQFVLSSIEVLQQLSILSLRSLLSLPQLPPATLQIHYLATTTKTELISLMKGQKVIVCLRSPWLTVIKGVFSPLSYSSAETADLFIIVPDRHGFPFSECE